MAIRVSGLVSGLDTDAIVQELVSAYATKKDKYTKAQTKLEWKMDAWKTMNSKIYGFYSSSLSAMRLSSAYNLKTASVSRTNAAKVTASASAVNGTHTLKVKSLAASAYMTGGEVKSKSGDKVTGDTSLADLGIESGSKLSLGGKEIEITDGMTVNKLISKFKESGVSASFDEANQRFFINATKSGKDGEFELMADNAKGLSALQNLGLFAAKDIDGNETTEMKKYRELAALNDGSEKSKTAAAIVAAVDNTLTLNGNEADIISSYETNARTASTYEAKQKFLDNYAAMNQLIADEAGNIDGYLDILTKSRDTITNDTGDEEEVRKLYTDAEIADMKKFIEANADSEDADVQAQVAEKQQIVDAKAKYDAFEAAKAYINDSANIEARREAQEFVDDADNQTAYAAAAAYVADADKTAAYNEAKTAYNASQAAAYRSDAARITGKDSEVVLNGATFTSSTGTFSINGLSITATEVTGDEAVTINVATDTKGIYDKIKSFLGQYNELLKAMDTAYNADSAGDYEPLTDDEQESMTDTQIEKWETKIKDSLLRRDSTLGNVSSAMKSIMQRSVTVDGKSYSLSSFGISTLGYFAADVNERGSLHIDGDPDDASSSGKTDKLMAAINADPETVTKFFQQLSTSLYDDLTKRMSSSSVSSAYTIYNDKQMSSEYSDYKKKISTWEDKLEYYEDYYYKKFSAMEKALSELQSSTSALGNLLGNG